MNLGFVIDLSLSILQRTLGIHATKPQMSFQWQNIVCDYLGLLLMEFIINFVRLISLKHRLIIVILTEC